MTEPRSVVITGASTGIGRACALRLDRMGWRVFAAVRNADHAEGLRKAASDRLTPIIIDVTGGATIAAAAELVAAEVGDAGLAGLVNNAGISVPGPLEFLPIEDFREQIEINVTGQVAVTQAFLPMLRQATGRVVFMGSISGKLATPFLGPYAASKFAIEAIADALRSELRPWGIDVAVVEPGSIATPIWEKGQAQADALEAKLSSRAHELYDPAVAAVRKTAREAEQRGIPADRVARVVARALTAKKPRTRYVVGRDARLQGLLAKFAPDRLRDRLVSRLMGLPERH